MYKEFKVIDSEYLTGTFEIYSNDDLFVFIDYIKDTVKIAHAKEFDRWSNAEVSETKVPYTTKEYKVFELLLLAETSLVTGNPIEYNSNHKKLTFT